MTTRRQTADREIDRWKVSRGGIHQGYVLRRQAGPGKIGYQALTTDHQDVGPLHASLEEAMAFLDTDPVAAWLARDSREAARAAQRATPPPAEDADGPEPYAEDHDPDHAEAVMQSMEAQYERQVYGD